MLLPNRPDGFFQGRPFPQNNGPGYCPDQVSKPCRKNPRLRPSFPSMRQRSPFSALNRLPGVERPLQPFEIPAPSRGLKPEGDKFSTGSSPTPSFGAEIPQCGKTFGIRPREKPQEKGAGHRLLAGNCSYPGGYPRPIPLWPQRSQPPGIWGSHWLYKASTIGPKHKTRRPKA